MIYKSNEITFYQNDICIITILLIIYFQMGNQSSVTYLSVSQVQAAVCSQPNTANPHHNDTDVTNTTWLSQYPQDPDANDSSHGGSYDTYAAEPLESLYQRIATILYSRVSVAVCAFGLIGNIFNLLVLVPKGNLLQTGENWAVRLRRFGGTSSIGYPLLFGYITPWFSGSAVGDVW